MDNLSIDMKSEEVKERWINGLPIYVGLIHYNSLSFEQAVQTFVMEIFSTWKGKHLMGENNTTSDEFTNHVESVTHRMHSEGWDLEAEAVAPVVTHAWKLCFYGYKYIMEKCPKVRLVLIQKKQSYLQLEEENLKLRAELYGVLTKRPV